MYSGHSNNDPAQEDSTKAYVIPPLVVHSFGSVRPWGLSTMPPTPLPPTCLHTTRGFLTSHDALIEHLYRQATTFRPCRLPRTEVDEDNAIVVDRLQDALSPFELTHSPHAHLNRNLACFTTWNRRAAWTLPEHIPSRPTSASTTAGLAPTNKTILHPQLNPRHKHGSARPRE